MKIGFGKVDVTPRVGVPLCGFGPFLNRYSIGIRDRLWARAMAVEHDGTAALIVSCDLVTISKAETQHARELVTRATGLPAEAVMVHCTHTHSGPDTSRTRYGWGGHDEPYLRLLPRRIAQAAIEAFERMQPATLAHAEVPCEGIGYNRQNDKAPERLEDALKDDWRPAKPELTDTTCHVVKAVAENRMVGFFSYFGCHPVTCCAATRQIHGDFVGVATNMIERETPGSVGLFLQGAQGDVNSCVVHIPSEQESLKALDVIAQRYARAVRAGLREAAPVAVDAVRRHLREFRFSRRPTTLDDLRERLAEQEKVINVPNATDEDGAYRGAVVNVMGLSSLIAALERGEPTDPPLQLQGIRVGPIAFLASPFETFQAIKNDVKAAAKSPIPLVMGLCNDACGYAPDRETAAAGGYATERVPLIHGHMPYARVHDELVQQLLEIDGALNV